MTDEEISKALVDNVMSGDIELAGVNANGEQTYRMTAQGKARIEKKMVESGIDLARMKSDPEYAAAVMSAILSAPTAEEE